jgi:uncharacterized protein (TIGR00290 family)
MRSGEILISWSGGKDSCLMLHEILAGGTYGIASLVCMIKEQEQRISMHGVPVELLDRQAAALGLPLEKISTSAEVSYEQVMERTMKTFAARGVGKIAYGDLFLEDIRGYREKLHGRIGMECLFPVWKRDTRAFARDFLASGYQAIVSCVDAKKLDISFAGRLYDASFLADLPEDVDPCGENGEFHTFVFDGPLFREAIRFKPSPPTLARFQEAGHDFRLGFCDLVPLEKGAD